MNLQVTDRGTGASPLDTRHRASPPPREPVLERTSLEDAQRALLNILEDSGAEKARLEEAQRAVLNILDDFLNEKAHLQGNQRAVLNILEDFDLERVKVEVANQRLEKQIEERREAEEALREAEERSRTL